jgi:hypothetical protein
MVDFVMVFSAWLNGPEIDNNVFNYQMGGVVNLADFNPSS